MKPQFNELDEVYYIPYMKKTTFIVKKVKYLHGFEHAYYNIINNLTGQILENIPESELSFITKKGFIIGSRCQNIYGNVFTISKVDTIFHTLELIDEKKEKISMSFDWFNQHYKIITTEPEKKYPQIGDLFLCNESKLKTKIIEVSKESDQIWFICPETEDQVWSTSQDFYNDFSLIEPENKINTKPSNPKQAIGIKKISESLIPINVLNELSLAMTEGALKYGEYNYREAGASTQVYYNACQRHLKSYMNGEDIDPDSGISHITKAIACLFIMRDCEINGNLKDDRNKAFNKEFNQKLNKLLGNLHENYKNN